MNLADRGELTGFLRKHGLSADKSLGQHFLCAPNVVLAIVESAKPYAGCLEIGPGPGILTSYLATDAEVIKAVEFDPRMIGPLKSSAPTCEVILGDALQVDLPSILESLPEPRALVSNMPYYITGPLLERFSACRHLFSCAVLMMQKEVGVKIVAKPGERERGSLSVNLQCEFVIEKIVNAPGDCFMPPPKVDSIVLKLTPRSDVFTSTFRRVVKASFMQNRKTLANNLMATFRQPREEVMSAMTAVGLTDNSRAFELVEETWVQLAVEVEARNWIGLMPQK